MGATDPSPAGVSRERRRSGSRPKGAGYRAYVQPDHPVLDRVFPPLTGDRASDLERALEALRAPRFEYDAFRGRVDFDRLSDQLAAAEERTVPLNCLTIASLMVSRLRAAGYSEDQAFVVLGQTRIRQDVYESDFHAWVFLAAGGATLWIDPGELVPRNLDGDRALSRLAAHALFNDRHLLFGDEAKRILRGKPGSGSPRCYLYGRHDPAIAKLIGGREWRALLGEIFAGEDGRAEAPDPDWADELVAAGLCRREGGSLAAGSKLELIRNADVEKFQSLFQPFLERYLEILERSLAPLEAAFSDCRAAERYAWPDVVHTIVAGMLMDLSIGGQLQLYEQVNATQGPTVVCAFESLPAANAFGVRWTSGAHCDFLELWHQGLGRDPLRLTPEACDLLHDAALGRPLADPRQLLWLRHLKLVSGRGPALRPALPTFLPDDSRRLLEVLRSTAGEIVEQAVAPTLRASRDAGWIGVRSGGGVTFAAARLVLELATDAVVEAGLLPRFPSADDAAEHWGRWLWIQPESGQNFRQYILSSSRPVGSA